MSYGAEASAIETRLKNGWASRTPVAWENVTFTPPAKAAWIRVRVLPADARQASIGTDPVFRHSGVLMIEIFSPLGQGAGVARAHADFAAALFRGVTGDSGIRYRAPSVDVVGQFESWFKLNVIVPFQRDTIF